MRGLSTAASGRVVQNGVHGHRQLMRGPPRRGPRTPARICTPLRGITPDASAGREPAAATLVPHELEPVDIDQAHVGDLEMRDHRQRQERDLQERLGERHA